MPTVKDVAQLANVSTATVSRTLSNPDKVQKSTRIRVQTAAKRLGYAPNAMARSLRRRESKTVLVILPDIANPFFSDIIHGIEDVAQGADYKVLLSDADHSVDRALYFMELYDSKQVDGILLLTADVPRDVFEMHHRVDSVPLVMACEYFTNSTLPVVDIDNLGSAKHAVDYLLSLGHTRIAVITGPLRNPICADRLRGYQQSLRAADIVPDPALIVEGEFDFQSGFNSAHQLLSGDHRPTAIFCQNDEMAIGALNAAKELAIEVPIELSVIGFDNIQFSEYCEPPLTTVHQPRQLIGEKAMKSLLDRLQNKKTMLHQSLATELIIRKSAGPCAGFSGNVESPRE